MQPEKCFKHPPFQILLNTQCGWALFQTLQIDRYNPGSPSAQRLQEWGRKRYENIGTKNHLVYEYSFLKSQFPLIKIREFKRFIIFQLKSPTSNCSQVSSSPPCSSRLCYGLWNKCLEFSIRISSLSEHGVGTLP